MTKITSWVMAIAAIVAMASCKDAGYKKTSSGILYKVVTQGDKEQVKKGEYLKMHISQKINDSLLGTTIGSLPAYIRVDSVPATYSPAEVFPLLHKGDSVVVVMLVDTLISKYGASGQLPPFMKKGGKILVTLKVEDVLKTDSLAQVDQDKEAKLVNERNVADIEKKLKDKNLQFKKTEKGTYVVVQNAGDGMAVDSGKYVTVKYTGKVFSDDKQFETNMDGSRPPFGFTIGQHQVIQGWDDGLRLLKKGGKATLYIPGSLAYGPQPGPGGKAYESLVFDVEVVDVADKAPAPPAQPSMPTMPPQGHNPHDGHGH